MLSVATLIVLPYFAFVFFGEGFNPLKKPRPLHLRERFRYGRCMGLAAFTGGLCTVALPFFLGTPLLVALATGVVVAVILSLGISARRMRSLR